MALANLNLNLEQTAELVTHVGPKRTVLVEGHMGTGKSSLLGIIANNLNAKKQETRRRRAVRPRLKHLRNRV